MVGVSDSFSSENILELASSALRNGGETPNSLNTPYEAIALVGHGSMVAVGFRLVGLGEDHNLSLSSVCPGIRSSLS